MSKHVRFDVPNALQQPNTNEGQSRSFSAELERLLFSGLRPVDTLEVRALLEDELFRPREGLTAEQAAALGYRRARFLSAALKLGPSELRDDPRRLYALHDWLALVDGIAGRVLRVHYCLALGALLAEGEERPELDRLIAELEQMDSVGVFLSTELGHGDMDKGASIETEAVYDAQRREFILSSPTPESCKFMANTGLALPKLGVVMARLISQNQDHGIFPFVVRLRAADGLPCPGIRIAPLGESPGDAFDRALTVFERVRIPKEQLVLAGGSILHDDGYFENRSSSPPRPSLGAADGVQISRVCAIGAAAATLRAATWIGVRYMAQRLAGVPGGTSTALLRHRNVQRDLFAGLATAYAVTFAARFLQTRFRARRRETEAEICRLTETLQAIATVEVGAALLRLRECCGALGTLSANRVGDYCHQLQGLTAEGDYQLVLLEVGNRLLDSPETPLSVLPGAAVSAALDPQEAVFLFGYREARLKQELKQSIGQTQRRTDDPLVLRNDHLSGTLALANAYAIRLLAECFRVAIADCGDDAGARALRTLFSLWALDHVEQHAGWFLGQGCISREAVEHLSSDRDRLCAGIEPHVLELVNAFGIDNTLLRAPIAQDDYVAAYEAFVAPVATRYKSGAFARECQLSASLQAAPGQGSLGWYEGGRQGLG